MSSALDIVSSDYVVRATWARGYVVDVTVVVDCVNSGRKNRFGVDGFCIIFDLDDGAEIKKTWNGKMFQHGSVCTVYHEGFSAPVHNEQAVLYFGFEARLDLAPPRRSLGLPRCMNVNGQVCAVQSCFARDLADCRNDYLEDQDIGQPQLAKVATPEPEESKDATRRQRSSSAPPRFFHRFGLVASPRGEENESSSSLATSICADSESGQQCSETDEDMSFAETVSSRRHRYDPDLDPHDCAVDSVSALSLPAGNVVSCHALSDSKECLHAAASRKRKFFQEDETDHLGVCSEAQALDGASSSRIDSRFPKSLQLRYYRRSAALKKRKYLHMDYLDKHFANREQVILNSVLRESCQPIVLEPNMFPYDTPAGVTHWTLWSRKWLKEQEVNEFVESWLASNLPEAIEWNHDDNMADGLSINLFHVHVYVRCPQISDTSMR